jgi:hypothetical protein
MHLPNGLRANTAVFLTTCPLLIAGLARAEAPRVNITGGFDLQAHEYQWTVTNHHDSPIVYVEFPQYHGDLFHSPDGWENETHNLVNVGWEPGEMGKVIARAAEGNPGIGLGGSRTFKLRISGQGQISGNGTAIVRFADGTELQAKGVSVPIMPEEGSPYLALIGAVILFGGWVVWRESKRSRRKAADATVQGAATSETSSADNS